MLKPIIATITIYALITGLRIETICVRMLIAVTIIAVVLLFGGCKVEPIRDKSLPKMTDYRFEKTAERVQQQASDKRTITVRFDGVAFGQAMQILTQETGAPIVWGQALDAALVYGTFIKQPLAACLETLARRAGGSVTQVGGVYYLGEIKKEDRAFFVTRIPPVEQSAVLEAVKAAGSMQGTVSVVASCLWICDDLESVRKIVAALDSIRERTERSYMAEVFFIRISDEQFIKLTADLQFNQIDVLSSTVNLEQLFEMFVDADGKQGWSKIDQRLVLNVPEGRKVTFEDGTEITRETRSTSPEGTSSVSGYQRFTDGTKLTLALNRVSDQSYMVDLDISVGVFDKSHKGDSVPAQKRSVHKAPGLLVRDSKIYYVGSLNRKDRANWATLFGVDLGKSNDELTIWLRVRELRNSHK